MFFTTKVASISTLVALAGVTQGNPLSEYGVKLDARTPPQQNGIQFVCTDFPDVCTNMCWGAYCVPESTTSLVYDKASSSKKRERRKAASCIDNDSPGNNRCSAGRPGAQPNYNCDEYPFASTKADNSNGKENRCSRCVPKSQNSKQGAVLSKGYRDFCNNNAPCNFQVFFGNPGASGHCSPGSQGNCNSDSAEKCSGSINIIQRSVEYDISPFGGFTKRDEPHVNGTYIPGPARFLTYRGTELDAPYGGFIGQPVHAPRAVNETLHNELIARHEYDHEGDDDQFDELTENMVSDIDYIREVVWEARLKQ